MSYILASRCCQNCKHSYYLKPGVASCRIKHIEIPYEKLNADHKKTCQFYEFWCDVKEKEKKK
jgi:hypothetical protein